MKSYTSIFTNYHQIIDKALLPSYLFYQRHISSPSYELEPDGRASTMLDPARMIRGEGGWFNSDCDISQRAPKKLILASFNIIYGDHALLLTDLYWEYGFQLFVLCDGYLVEVMPHLMSDHSAIIFSIKDPVEAKLNPEVKAIVNIEGNKKEITDAVHAQRWPINSYYILDYVKLRQLSNELAMFIPKYPYFDHPDVFECNNYMFNIAYRERIDSLPDEITGIDATAIFNNAYDQNWGTMVLECFFEKYKHVEKLFLKSNDIHKINPRIYLNLNTLGIVGNPTVFFDYFSPALKSIEINTLTKGFFDRLPLGIESITFNRITFSKKNWQNFLTVCPRLKALQFYKCRLNYESGHSSADDSEEEKLQKKFGVPKTFIFPYLQKLSTHSTALPDTFINACSSSLTQLVMDGEDFSINELSFPHLRYLFSFGNCRADRFGQFPQLEHAVIEDMSDNNIITSVAPALKTLNGKCIRTGLAPYEEYTIDEKILNEPFFRISPGCQTLKLIQHTLPEGKFIFPKVINGAQVKKLIICLTSRAAHSPLNFFDRFRNSF